MSRDDALIVRLDTPLPLRLTTGKGQVLYLTGRCYHPERTIRTLSLTVNGVPHAVPNHSLVRPDVPSDDPAVGDATPNSLTSGFWAAVPFAGRAASTTVELAWRAELDDGSVRAARSARSQSTKPTVDRLRPSPHGRAARDHLSGRIQPRAAVLRRADHLDPYANASELVLHRE